MKNANFNGQNSVATSAMIKNAVVKAVKMINKAEIGKKTHVMIDEGLRLSFDGIRFIRGAKDNFIFNGKIAKKSVNGRYSQGIVEIHYKNLDNEQGLCLNDMVNGVLGAILADIDNWIINYYKSESSSKWEYGLELYQNFRNDYFGSRLVVDNSENLDSPDTLEGPDALNNDEDYNLEFLRDRMPVIPIDLIKQGVNDYINDEYENRRNSCTGRFECDFEKFADNVWKIVWGLVLDNDLSEETLEFDTRNYMEFNDRLYYMIDIENINDLCFNSLGRLCQNFDNVVNRIVNVIKDYYINYIPSYLDQFGDCVITVYWDMFSENDVKLLIENEKVALAVRDMLLSDNIILDKNGFLIGGFGVYLTVDYNKIPA